MEMDSTFPDAAYFDIWMAARAGSMVGVQRLIAAGADIHAVDAFDKTPLHYASAAGHHKITRLLLTKGSKWGERLHVNCLSIEIQHILEEFPQNKQGLL
jgi:ankyrin repeat protein